MQGSEVPADFNQHAFNILHYFVVLKAQDTDSRRLQEPISLSVMVLRAIEVVRGPVELDRQLLGRTVEIQYVHPRAMLAAEFPPVQLAAFEVFPQARFSRSQAGAELTAARVEPLEVVQAHGLQTS